MSPEPYDFARDEADYVSASERRAYEDRGYRKNARPYSARQAAARLADLALYADRCAAVVARGRVAYLADGEEGELLRDAAERRLIAVGNVVEKLHSDVKDHFHPRVPWRDITRLRNLLGHHYDRVDQEVVWEVLTTHIPRMVLDLGLPPGGGKVTLPEALRGEPGGGPDEPFPARS